MKIYPEISKILKDSGTDFFAMHPCEKIAGLYDLISRDFRHVYLSREEEGVGICGGAYLAGAKPAMLIQSSGLGNMANALCSFIQTYRMPLLVLASWRGVYQERILAQIPLGRRIPRLLKSLEISYTSIENSDDLPLIGKAADNIYGHNIIHVILLSPRLSAEEEIPPTDVECGKSCEKAYTRNSIPERKEIEPVSTRFMILKCVAPYLEGKIVVCNLGRPCKELYNIKHQKSNFYMLGSMGMASSIGLGISLFTSKQVVVIDGDGSLLMNLGTLSTIARESPSNLTILAIDNGVHGSTGNQPTATACRADLEAIAWGSGFRKTFKEADPQKLLATLHSLEGGPNFIHILAKPGNAQVPDVPLAPKEIKNNVMEVLNS
jgi:sulfopyruvate decarboxylase subunit beta